VIDGKSKRSVDMRSSGNRLKTDWRSTGKLTEVDYKNPKIHGIAANHLRGFVIIFGCHDLGFCML
jgi:hypothetical protein